MEMTKIEDKLLNMMDNGQSVNKSLEQDSLATAILNENNVAIKNLPDSPNLNSRLNFDDIETNTHKLIIEEKPELHHHSHNHQHSHHHSNHINQPSAGFAPSSDFYAQQPQFNQPTYYKPGTNEPVPSTFPGPHSQTHPMYGYNYPSAPSSASYHSFSTTPMTPSSHYQTHYGPNYHSNAANFGQAYNNRQMESTTSKTASAPPPNWYSTEDKPKAQARIGKSYFEISTCSGQFDCGTGFCIPFSKLCDGKDDCGTRLDEQNCQHPKIES